MRASLKKLADEERIGDMRILFVTIEGNAVAEMAEQYAIGTQSEHGKVGQGRSLLALWPETGRTPMEQVDMMGHLVDAVTEDDSSLLCVLSASPYVLRALQVAAAEHGVATHVECVLIQLDGSPNAIEATESLYDAWVRPFERLEARECNL